MGTAVLYPQDCLQPRSRHKHRTSGMIYPLECAAGSKRVLLPAAQRHEAGLLPRPAHGGHSSPMDFSRRGSGTSLLKRRKGPEQRDVNHPSRFVSDVPSYKVLQRPKQGGAAVNLLAQLFLLDEVKAQSVTVVAKATSTKGSQNDGLDSADKCISRGKAEFGALEVAGDGFKRESRSSDSKPVKCCDGGGSLCPPDDLSEYLNGTDSLYGEGYKLPNTKVGALKGEDMMLQSGLDDSVRPSPSKVLPEPLMTKAAGTVHNSSGMDRIVQRSEELGSSLPPLRRTSTEPQISAHLRGQYKSKAMQVSFENSKLQSHVHCRGFTDNNFSPSCQERWAGPAYTCSPSPSALPLPKLFLPHTKFSSLEIRPIVRQYTNVHMQSFLGSSIPSESGGAWDAAFATKSLRKMLNLDPC